MRRRHSSRLSSSQEKKNLESSISSDNTASHPRRRSTRKNYRLEFPEFEEESAEPSASRRKRSRRNHDIIEEENVNSEVSEDNGENENENSVIDEKEPQEEDYNEEVEDEAEDEEDDDEEEDDDDANIQSDDDQESIPGRSTRHSSRLKSGRNTKVVTPSSPILPSRSRKPTRGRGRKRGRGRTGSAVSNLHEDIKTEETQQPDQSSEEKVGLQDLDTKDQSDEKQVEEAKETEEEVVVPVKRGRGRPPKFKPGSKKYIAAVELKKRRANNPNPRSTMFNGKREVATTFPVPLDDNGNEYSVNAAGDEYDIRDDEDEEGNQKIDRLGYLQGNRDFRVRTFTVPGQGEKLYMLSTEPARCLGYRDAYYLFLRHPTLYKFILTMDEKQDLVDRRIMPNSYKSRTIGLVTARSVFKEFGARIIIGGRNIIDDYRVSKLREDKDVIEGALATPDDFVPINKKDYDKKKYIAWHGGSQIYQKQQNLQFVSSNHHQYHHLTLNDSSDSLFKKSDLHRNTSNNNLLSNELVPNSVHKYLDFPIYKPFKINCEFSDNTITEENWIHENSHAAGIYNHDLIEKRLNNMESKYLGENKQAKSISKKSRKKNKSKNQNCKDFLTGITFVPNITQPKYCQWYNVTSSAEHQQKNLYSKASINFNNWSQGISYGGSGSMNNNLIYETHANMNLNSRYINNDIIKLSDVNLKVFDDCVSSEIREAILSQQRFERSMK